MKKPQLNIVYTPNCWRIHYLNLEDFLRSVYGLRDFDILKRAKVIHGDFPVYIITKSLTFTRTKTKELRRASINQILTTLCVDGHILPGTYVLDTTPPKSPIKQYKQLLLTHRDPLHPACIQFKNRHLDNRYFCQMCRQIDHTFCEWLRNESEPL